MGGVGWWCWGRPLSCCSRGRIASSQKKRRSRTHHFGTIVNAPFWDLQTKPALRKNQGKRESMVPKWCAQDMVPKWCVLMKLFFLDFVYLPPSYACSGPRATTGDREMLPTRMWGLGSARPCGLSRQTPSRQVLEGRP